MIGRVVGVSDGAATAANVRVSLAGAPNFRDVGGHPTFEGGRVRRATVFRSEALHQLTDADIDTLARLGVRVVYDLRLDEERERAPSLLPHGVRCRHLPIGGRSAKTSEMVDLLVAGKLAEVPETFLERLYEAMTEVAAPTFAELLTALAEDDGVPALIHCTAGKDRTGISIALLLALLGVSDDAILDDYELSAVHYTERNLDRLQERLAASGIGPQHYRVVFGAPRAALASVLATLRAQHGSIESYLTDCAGLDPEVVGELRHRLVERSGK